MNLVKKALEHILKISWFHNSCKQNFCVTKTPEIHLFFSFILQGLYLVECSVLCQFDHQSTSLFEKVKKGIGENDLFSSLLGSL